MRFDCFTGRAFWQVALPAACLFAVTGHAAETATPASADAIMVADDISEKYPDLLDGTLSVAGDIADDNAEHSSHVAGEPVLAPWFAFKRRFEQRTGIAFSGSYGVLWQNYSSYTPLGEQDSVGHKFTFNASAALLNRNQPNALSFDIAIEDRSPWTTYSPLQAGVRAGSGLPTAATWGDFNLGITQAYIRQTVAGGKFQWTIGKLFAPNYVNAYPFFDDNRQFLNLAFSTGPTIAVPLRGFGAVAAVYPGDGSLYVTGGMFTANSSDTGWTIDDFINRDEHFYFVEIGSSSFARRPISIHARGPMDRNNFHFTFWYRDALALRPGEAPGLSRPDDEAYGVAFNANFMVNPNMMVFVRGGASTGAFAKGNLTAGFGWRSPNRSSDLFGLAGAWVMPDQPNLGMPLPQLRDQWTTEVFYRYQLTSNFAVTPDFQLIFNPSLNPTKDTLSVFSLRGRIAF